MILLPDDDELPVGAQVNALIGEALRQSVAGAEPSPGFAARLAAALDEVDDGLAAAPARAAAPCGVRGGAGGGGAGSLSGGGGPDEAVQGAEKVAASS